MPMPINRRQFVTGAIATPILLLATPVAEAQEAGHLNAADEWLYDACGQMWPSRGAFETYVSEDGVYSVALYATFTRSEITALSCVAPEFEARFVIGGFLNTHGVQGSSTFASNFPGGRKRSLAYDQDDDTVLRYGFIRTGDLEPGEYEVRLKFWGLEVDEYNNPWVAIQLRMRSEDEGETPLFLSRGNLNDVIYFHGGDEYGYQWLPFGH